MLGLAGKPRIWLHMIKYGGKYEAVLKNSETAFQQGFKFLPRRLQQEFSYPPVHFLKRGRIRISELQTMARSSSSRVHRASFDALAVS